MMSAMEFFNRLNSKAREKKLEGFLVRLIPCRSISWPRPGHHYPSSVHDPEGPQQRLSIITSRFIHFPKDCTSLQEKVGTELSITLIIYKLFFSSFTFFPITNLASARTTLSSANVSLSGRRFDFRSPSPDPTFATRRAPKLWKSATWLPERMKESS